MDPVVILATEVVSVGPGQQARLAVRVRNQGRRVESYRVDVVGVPAAFADVDPQTVSVLPGREAEVGITFRPPAGASTPTGTIPFAVRATSDVDAGSAATAEGRLELAGVGGLQAWAADTMRSGRWSAKYNIEFANHGNAAVRLVVNAHDPAGALTLSLSSDVVDLPPGGVATTEVTAKARHPFLRGTPVNRVVQVSCQNFPFGAERPVAGGAPPADDENHRTFQLTFEQRPILPKLAIVALLLVAAIVIAVVVLQLRSSEEFTLGLDAPATPTEVAAEPLGPTSISLSWLAVPDAATYTYTVNGTPADDMVEPVAGDRRVDHAVEDLDSDTEYCFTVAAIGAGESGTSGSSPRVCAATGVPTELATPTDVSAKDAGVDRFNVTWTFPRGDREGVTFTVLVDNAPTQEGIADSPTTIEIPAEADPQQVEVRVQAVRDGERSAPSEPFELTIEPLPVVTTPTTPATGGGETTTPGGSPPTTPGGSPPTTSDGGTPTTPDGTAPTSTTTGTPTTTTTAAPTTTLPSPAQEVVQDLPPTVAAMLDTWLPPSQGGLPLEERMARLAQDFQVPIADIGVFSSRDTVAADADGQPDSAINSEEPQTLFFYVATPNAGAAEEICGRVSGGCRVVTLAGAATTQAAAGARVLVLDSVDSSTPITDVDATIVARRDQLAPRAVHMLDGARFEGFDANEIVVYASGFASSDEIDQACVDFEIEGCQSVVLTPS